MKPRRLLPTLPALCFCDLVDRCDMGTRYSLRHFRQLGAGPVFPTLLGLCHSGNPRVPDRVNDPRHQEGPGGFRLTQDLEVNQFYRLDKCVRSCPFCLLSSYPTPQASYEEAHTGSASQIALAGDGHISGSVLDSAPGGAITDCICWIARLDSGHGVGTPRSRYAYYARDCIRAGGNARK